jgi:hypothetical protein
VTGDPGFASFRDVLYEALPGTAPAIGNAAPMDVLRRVTVAAFNAASETAAALQPLNAVAAATSIEAAVAAARSRYPDANAFSEAVYFARCLGRDAAQTLRVAAANSYLDGTDLPGDGEEQRELAADRLVIRELTTYQRGWLDPLRLEGSLNLFRLWRNEYRDLCRRARAPSGCDRGDLRPGGRGAHRGSGLTAPQQPAPPGSRRGRGSRPVRGFRASLSLPPEWRNAGQSH